MKLRELYGSLILAAVFAIAAMAATINVSVDPASHQFTLNYSDGATTYTSTGTLAPVAQPAVISPSAFESDNWLNELGGTDPHGYFNAGDYPAKMGTYGIFIVGDHGGDYPTIQTAMAAGQASGKDICIQYQCTTSAGKRATYPGIQPIVYSGRDALHPLIVCCTPDFSSTIPPPIVGQISIGDAKASTGPHNIIVANLAGYDTCVDPATYTGLSTTETGIYINNTVPGGGHLLFSGIRTHGYKSGMEIQASGAGTLKTAIILNPQIDFCVGMNFGLYASNVQDLLVRGGCLNHDGWLDGKVAKTALRQSIYIQEQIGGPDPQVRVQGVMLAYSAAQGIEMRTGGEWSDSIVFGCSQAGFVAERASTIHDVLVDGGGGRVDISCPGGGTGWGLQSNICPTCAMTHCTVINGPAGVASPYMIQTASTGAAPSVASIVSLDHCIAFNWQNATGISIANGGNAAINPRITQTACDLTGTGKYPDKSRTLLKYIQSLKMPGITDEPTFFAAVCAQNEMNWDERLTEKSAYNWIANQGYGQPGQN